ncbi:MAG: hypothetical protein Q4Q53_07885, partial [Methanocorpusculum sp.]|nr:hypothetical protein [Methanocorpusculum sp.]
ILIGVILIVLRKRDLTATVFMTLGMMTLVLAADVGLTLAPAAILGAFLIIVSLVILMTKDKKKYLLFIIPLLIGLKTFLYPLIGTSNPVIYLLKVLIVFVTLYFAFACACERTALPFSKILTADVSTDFRSVGSVIGYLLLSISSVFWCTYYFFGEAVFDFEGALAIDMMCGSMMIIVGVLLAIFGNMRFTPIMFILIGFTTLAGSMVFGSMNIVIGALAVILGIFCILRVKRRILPAVMLFFLGTAYILPGIFGESVSPVFGVVNLVVAMISLYIAAAVFSSDYTEDKLPLF